MNWQVFVFLTASDIPETNDNCKLGKDTSWVISLAFVEPWLSSLSTLHWLANTFLHCLYVFDGSQERSFDYPFSHHGCNDQSLGCHTHWSSYENYWPILQKRIVPKFSNFKIGNDCSSIIHLFFELLSNLNCWIDVLSFHGLD